MILICPPLHLPILRICHQPLYFYDPSVDGALGSPPYRDCDAGNSARAVYSATGSAQSGPCNLEPLSQCGHIRPDARQQMRAWCFHDSPWRMDCVSCLCSLFRDAILRTLSGIDDPQLNWPKKQRFFCHCLPHVSDRHWVKVKRQRPVHMCLIPHTGTVGRFCTENGCGVKTAVREGLTNRNPPSARVCHHPLSTDKLSVYQCRAEEYVMTTAEFKAIRLEDLSIKFACFPCGTQSQDLYPLQLTHSLTS